MTSEQILRIAHDSEPETMAKVATAMQLLEESDPDSLKDIVDEIHEIARITEVEIEKTAGVMDSAKAISLGAASVVVASLGTAVAMDLYDATKRGLTKSTNFKRIMETNPDLRSMNKGRVRMAFDSIHRFGGPEITADPLVAGAMIKHLAEVPELSPEGVFKVIAARKNIVDVKKNQYAPNFNPKDEKKGGGGGKGGKNPSGFPPNP